MTGAVLWGVAALATWPVSLVAIHLVRRWRRRQELALIRKRFTEELRQEWEKAWQQDFARRRDEVFPPGEGAIVTPEVLRKMLRASIEDSSSNRASLSAVERDNPIERIRPCAALKSWLRRLAAFRNAALCSFMNSRKSGVLTKFNWHGCMVSTVISCGSFVTTACRPSISPGFAIRRIIFRPSSRLVESFACPWQST